MINTLDAPYKLNKVTDMLNNFNGICIGMTRNKVISILGQPTDFSAVTRKYKYPMIYKFNNNEVEYHFGPHENDGLFMIYVEDRLGNPIVVLR